MDCDVVTVWAEESSAISTVILVVTIIYEFDLSAEREPLAAKSS